MVRRNLHDQEANANGEGNESPEMGLDGLKERMNKIIERQKDLVLLINVEQTEPLVSEFKMLGEEYNTLSAKFMKSYFKK